MLRYRLPLVAIVVSSLSAAILRAEPPADRQASEAPTKGRLPITISKETTYITEPLRPDGYPDYLAALNRLGSEGVTPENNAVVPLVLAFGPDKIASESREKFFKMLGIRCAAGHRAITMSNTDALRPKTCTGCVGVSICGRAIPPPNSWYTVRPCDVGPVVERRLPLDGGMACRKREAARTHRRGKQTESFLYSRHRPRRSGDEEASTMGPSCGRSMRSRGRASPEGPSHAPAPRSQDSRGVG